MRLKNVRLEDFAPAKLNLFLHVLGRREDGYHLLESLVSFATIGDRLWLEPGASLSLSLSGPFSVGLEAEGDNLILKAARAFVAHVSGAQTGAFFLEKNLPIASGIGGGSTDAAAALRLLARHNGIALDDPRVMDAARMLGADVPVCLDPALRLMRGIGHELGPKLASRPMPGLLINPGVAVSTAQIFGRLGLEPGDRFVGPQGERNDLAAPAIALEPVIGVVLDQLAAQPGTSLVRMSGSGATCFALFESEETRDAALASITTRDPAITTMRWWVAPCSVLMPT